ncbi:MAG: hypothetical protein RLY71_1974 [Pseudomonadota bacterium]|jgi:hypothetical protein
MKKLSLILMIGAVLLTSACGGGGGGGSSNDNPPAAANEVPGWAFADSAAFARYTDGVQASASDSADPVDLTAADAPASDTDEPTTI